MAYSIKNKAVIILCAVLVSGCEKPLVPGTTELNPSEKSPAASGIMKELSTAAGFSPVVLKSAAEIGISAPAPLTSEQVMQETAELLKHQPARTSEQTEIIKAWDKNSVSRWNEISRTLVIKAKMNPPLASRLYTLLSVAQYDALVSTGYHKKLYNRKLDIINGLKPVLEADGDSTYPSAHAAVAEASLGILASAFPDEKQYLLEKATENKESRIWAGLNLRSDISAGEQIGSQVAAKVLQRAAEDGSKAAAEPVTLPVHAGAWFSSPTAKPLLPSWGKVKPWLVESIDSLPVNPPPVYGSEDFNQALAEVRQFSDNRTPEQARIADFWADGAGTYTPAGHWNEIAATLISKHGMSELQSAFTFATMNMAIMDAGICCWAIKYKFSLIRPSQADPKITTPVGLPNFPTYTSGHSSFSGAASRVLGFVFPAEKDSVAAMAEEAAISRIYGGIHFRFDSDEGLKNGRAIGDLSVDFANRLLSTK